MKRLPFCLRGLLATLPGLAFAQAAAPAPTPAPAPAGPRVIRIDAARVTAQVSPTHYGLMTEEINYSYDGGLHGELVRNRAFQDDEQTPVHWTAVQENGGTATLTLDRTGPLSDARPVSLRLDATIAGPGARAGAANDGYWGMPVNPNTTYRASFHARATAGFSGPLTVSLESADGAQVHASAQVSGLGEAWKKYDVTLRTGKVTPSAANRLVLRVGGSGTVWLGFVSLFPPTWHDRPNGNRRDIMQLLADMHPSFLRFPGGNYLQGRTLATRFDWKKTLGDPVARPGHLNDAWRYRSTDGMGLLEFLLWCEDLKMQPVLGVFAGFTLRGTPTPPGPELQVFVQEALDEIEYVTGGVKTTWGARRAQDGHPAPFPLTYVEIGNEDFFDRAPGSYDGRFAQFYDAIKAKYPHLQVIATTPVKGRTPDVVDEHYYPRTAIAFEADATRYDSYDRKGPKIFVGEWATRIGSPTPNLAAALGDAAWMTGMERNSDLVVMHAYAPLFVNVSDLTPRTGSMQWATDLIGYDALHSYGSPAYWAQQMFSSNHGDTVLASTAGGGDTEEWQPPTPRGATEPPPKKQVPRVFHSVTRDHARGTIYVKLVNTAATAQTVQVDIAGAKIAAKGQAIVLSSASLNDTNSITDPVKVVPAKSEVKGLGSKFSRELAPYSITVLVLSAK